VPLIEAGKAHDGQTLELLAKHLEPIQAAGSDTIVLGCTHYPFLRKAIRQLLGNQITLIDTSEAVVKQLKRQLEALAPQQALHPADSSQFGSVRFFSSKDEQALLKMAQELMHTDLQNHRVSTAQLGSVS
jgi:glutamate racemase